MGGVLSSGKSSRFDIASQAEILRARQKDDEFVEKLRDKISNLSLRFGGCRLLLPFLQSDVPAKLIYFIVTSGFGNQTLGEEYTGIVQADLKTLNVPSMSARVLAALLECFGEKGLIKLLERLRISINKPQSRIRPEATAFMNQFISRLKTAIPLLILVHKGLFYTFGRYYSLGKRIAGVDYAKINGRRPSDGVSWGLRLLGCATIAQCVIRLWQSRNSLQTSEPKPEVPEYSVSEKCQLCVDALPTTATPCGHLFCWNCLADWLRNRPQCPICRERVTSSRIVYLMNL